MELKGLIVLAELEQGPRLPICGEEEKFRNKIPELFIPFKI
jgi:hypothetical protein